MPPAQPLLDRTSRGIAPIHPTSDGVDADLDERARALRARDLAHEAQQRADAMRTRRQLDMLRVRHGHKKPGGAARTMGETASVVRRSAEPNDAPRVFPPAAPFSADPEALDDPLLHAASDPDPVAAHTTGDEAHRGDDDEGADGIDSSDAPTVRTDTRGRSTNRLMIGSGWAMLLDCVDAIHARKTHAAASARSTLNRLRGLAADHGVGHAKDLPSRETVEGWMRLAGWPTHTIQNTMSVYRSAVNLALKMAPDAGYVRFGRKPSPQTRNLRSIRSLHARIAALDDGRDRAVDTVIVISEIFPAMGRALKAWLRGPGMRCRPATQASVIGAFDRMCAAFYREVEAGNESLEHVSILTPYYLYLLRRDNPVLEERVIHEQLIEEDLLPFDATMDASDAPPQISLLLYLLLRQANVANVLELYGRTKGATGTLVATLADDHKFIWLLVRDLYAPALAERGQTARWRDIADEFQYISKYLEDRRIQSGMTKALKDKERLVGELASICHVVCIGLPDFVRTVRELGEQYVHAAQHARTKQQQRQRDRLREVFESRLEEYVVLATFVTDPMRVKNIANARLGIAGEIRPDVVTEAHGGHVLRGMTSYYSGTGADNPLASLKEETRAGRDQRERRRVWPWPPACYDRELFLLYLLTVRRRRVIERGLLTMPDGARATETTYDFGYDVAEGKRAFFVSPRESSSPLGGFADTTLSQLFGRGFYWILTTSLRHLLPAYAERGKRTKAWAPYYGLIDAPHGVRTMWATFLIGVVGANGPEIPTPEMGVQRQSGTQYCVHALGDDEWTLRSEYESLPASVAAHLFRPVTDYRHPRAHVPWMFRVMQGEEIDWALETKIPRPRNASSGPTLAEECIRQQRIDAQAEASRKRQTVMSAHR